MNMYSSRGSNGYGQQQPYSSESSYAPQSLGATSLLGGGMQETELSGYRAHGHVPGRPSAAATAVTVQAPQHYGGQYSSVYGSASQQISPMGTKGSVTTAFEARINYGSSMPESPKFAANEYVPSSSRGYGQKADQLYSDKVSEYPSVDRRQYGDHHGAYLGRDLPSDTANRYAESLAFGHEHQSKMYDRLEQTTAFRQEEMLKARALQSASVEGGARQADYLAARATVNHPAQDPIAYGGRIDHESRNLSMLSGSSYIGKHTASILGAAPRRSIDDLIYAPSSNPGYGVSLPPGRDYGTGKGLLGASLESDYPTSMLGRASHLRLDDPKDDRATYGRELERREKDRDYLREREKDWEREKDRLRERERERERARERERKREREREREKERERERERREKDKDREHKRKLELKHEQTPPRVSRDRQGSSLPKDIRSLRRESPRHEVLHRLHSPVKEKRREYACKVFSFSFVEAERDFLSLDKRYPRLYVSPECSKVVVYWPKKNLHLSLYTPVSFEHDFVEEAAAKRKEPPFTQPANDISKSGGQTTIWNAKIILMSGLGQNDLKDLLSERIHNDRIPHFCNMLRFAVLRKNNCLTAIGGPWDTVDGGDPSVDDSSLIQTALRYAKDQINLDLKNCRHWNRFLEIHYERVGKDGLFSHKEVTVLYVPDVAECLPTQDSWRHQWLNHKKAVSERERLLKKEIPGDKEEGPKDKKKPEHLKDSMAKTELQKKNEPSSSGPPRDDSKKDANKLKSRGTEEGKEKDKAAEKKDVIESMAKTELQKKKESSSSGPPGDDSKKEKDANKPKSRGTEEGKVKDKSAEKKDVIESTEEEKNVVHNVQGGNSNPQTAVGTKPGKKKIIKRIVKKKVAKKNDSTENATKQNDEADKEGAEGKSITSEVDGHKDDGGLSGNPPAVKTFVRKRIVKKPVNSAMEKDECSSLAEKTMKEAEGTEDKANAKPEDSNAVIQEDSTKTTVKKKVVKRVPNRKAGSAEKVAEDIKVQQNEEAVEKQMNEVISKSTSSLEMKPDKREEKQADGKDLSGSAMETECVNQKVSQNDNCEKSNERQEPKGKKESKEQVEKESRSKTIKTAKEKKRSDEPPQHPGFILQTKGSKVSKIKSSSLSLESLLDYSGKDDEESTFELSLFAESFYEMLQYEMGCRLLAFLQKLRIKFVAKRSEGKRQREETSQKENEGSSSKRVKTETTTKNTKLTDTTTKDTKPTDTTSEDIKPTDTTSEDIKPTDTTTKPTDTTTKDIKLTETTSEDIKPTDTAIKDFKSTKTEDTDDARGDGSNIVKEEPNATEHVDRTKEDNIDEEDPEEDPEEDEEMPQASPHHDSIKEECFDTGKKAGDAVGEDAAQTEQNEKQETAKKNSETTSSLDPSNKDKLPKVESKTKGTQRGVDKELLQAFRFFDRNRVGYIRVEDLRLIIHNLGKFLPHRDVKELVQSALLESNTGRDDRVLYDKLVKMSDI